MLAPYISNMTPNIRCFVMARGVPDRVLENSEVLQKLAEQVITKAGCAEKCRTILGGDHGIFFSSVFFTCS